MSDLLDRYIELPHDKDGRTIHLGDTVYLSDLDKGVEVESITLHANGNTSIHFINSRGGCGNYSPSMVSVERPDSWHRIWEDYANLTSDGEIDGSVVYELLARAQKLSEEEPDE